MSKGTVIMRMMMMIMMMMMITGKVQEGIDHVEHD